MFLYNIRMIKVFARLACTFFGISSLPCLRGLSWWC